MGAFSHNFDWKQAEKGEVVIMEVFLTQVGNFGFPIVLSVYLLVRIEGKLDRLTESIYHLSRALGSEMIGE